jgi:orotidine-5'-phosphate decarboxylase
VVKLLVALDVPNELAALSLTEALAPVVDGFKVGLELLMGVGPGVVSKVCESGLPVFVDAKLHDIPNTVERASARIAALGARWVTTHAAGGPAMLAAAGRGVAGSATGVLAVTMLTSLGQAALRALGILLPPDEYVLTMARLARDAGAEGVVSSVSETASIKGALPDLTVVNPGIRPRGSGSDDQARVATPAMAATAGADLIVVGRPITNAADPVAAAMSIAAELGRPVSPS